MGTLIKTPATRLEKNVWVHLQERPQSVELDESVMEGWMDGWIAAASRLSTSEPQASKGSSVLSYMKSTVKTHYPGNSSPSRLLSSTIKLLVVVLAAVTEPRPTTVMKVTVLLKPRYLSRAPPVLGRATVGPENTRDCLECNGM